MKHECIMNYNRYNPSMDDDYSGFYNQMKRHTVYK